MFVAIRGPAQVARDKKWKTISHATSNPFSIAVSALPPHSGGDYGRIIARAASESSTSRPGSIPRRYHQPDAASLGAPPRALRSRAFRRHAPCASNRLFAPAQASQSCVERSVARAVHLLRVRWRMLPASVAAGCRRAGRT